VGSGVERTITKTWSSPVTNTLYVRARDNDGVPSDTASRSITLSLQTDDALCGTAKNIPVYEAPTSNLCANGASQDGTMSSTTDKFTWQCKKTNYEIADCSVTKLVGSCPPLDGITLKPGESRTFWSTRLSSTCDQTALGRTISCSNALNLVGATSTFNKRSCAKIVPSEF
jgi:hypothetical protein